MTLDQLHELWSKDANIDRTELGEEANKIPQLHSKYYKFYSTERLVLRKLQEELKQLTFDKSQWLQGNMDRDDMKARGWEPNPLKILKADLDAHIDSDQEVVDFKLKIAYQQEKVDFLDSAIKYLTNRGFNLKAAIDWEKFKMGV